MIIILIIIWHISGVALPMVYIKLTDGYVTVLELGMCIFLSPLGLIYIPVLISDYIRENKDFGNKKIW